ncbi:MAG: signal recognition particle receptor subunit alpha [Alphaproteobacteria bacterium]
MIWGFGKKNADSGKETGVSKVFAGLAKSSARLTEGVAALTKRKLDAAALEDLEDSLIRSDMGAAAAAKIVEGFSSERFGKEASDSEIRAALAQRIEALMAPRERPLDLSGPPKPRIVLVVGVNGSGKTTTVGKLCALLAQNGAKVVVGAADTYRAAAIEQLKVWADHSGATLISRGKARTRRAWRTRRRKRQNARAQTSA